MEPYRVLIMTDGEYFGMPGWVLSKTENEDGTFHYRIMINENVIIEDDNLFLIELDRSMQ